MSDIHRELKNEAAKLLQKGRVDKALEVYREILQTAPNDVALHVKIGDLLRRMGRGNDAVAHYSTAAHIYAQDGMLLKAIAACKLILEIDQDHRSTQSFLADLYAKKTGRTHSATSSVPAIMAPPPRNAPIVRSEATPSVIIPEPTRVELTEAPYPDIPLFSDLPKNAFIQLMEQMHMKSVSAGETIISERDTGQSMFIISNGRVKVTRLSDNGQEQILAHLGEGAFFGEMALLSEAPRSASVVAEEETLLFEVSREVIGEITQNFPSVSNTMLRFYRQRLLLNLMITSPAFRALHLTQRRALVEQFKTCEFEANETVVEEGDKGDGIYVILSGRVEVSKKVDGKRIVLGQLKESDLFGEMSYINNAPAYATVKTLRKAIIFKLPRRALAEVISTHPQLVEHITSIMAARQKTNSAIMSGQIHTGDDGYVLI